MLLNEEAEQTLLHIVAVLSICTSVPYSFPGHDFFVCGWIKILFGTNDQFEANKVKHDPFWTQPKLRIILLYHWLLTADVYAFNVGEMCQKGADIDTSRIKHHNVIYNLMADLVDSINSKLPTTPEEKIVGRSFILLVYK